MPRDTTRNTSRGGTKIPPIMINMFTTEKIHIAPRPINIDANTFI